MAIHPAETRGQVGVPVDDPTLAEITRRLVGTYRPERILSSAREREEQPSRTATTICL